MDVLLSLLTCLGETVKRITDVRDARGKFQLFSLPGGKPLQHKGLEYVVKQRRVGGG